MLTTLLLLLFTALCVLLSADRAWDNVTKPERNSLVFDGRHRAYGAFVLRREYDRRAMFAFVGALGLVGGAVMLPRLFGHGSAIHVAKPTTEIIVDLSDTYVAPPTPPAPPQPPQPPTAHVTPPAGPVQRDIVVIPVDSTVTTTEPDPNKKDPDSIDQRTGDDSGRKGPDTGGDKPTGGDTGTPFGTRLNPTGMADVDVVPEFIGGMDALRRFVQDHIRFPEDDVTAQKEWVEFVVDADGSVVDVTAKGKAAKAYAEAAEAVVRAMPKWKPARKQGAKVACRLVLPIDFRTK